MAQPSKNARIIDMVVSFFKFAALSGLGWALDFSIYLLLINFLNIPPPFANFVSAMAATTFVYFISLKKIFNRNSKSGVRFLLIYWMYQLFSIAIYSAMLDPIIYHMTAIELSSLNNATMAKIIVTPLNLITNYIFMKILTRRMPV